MNGECEHLGEVGAGTTPLKRRAGLIAISVLKGGGGHGGGRETMYFRSHRYAFKSLFTYKYGTVFLLTFLNLIFLIFNGTILMI